MSTTIPTIPAVSLEAVKTYPKSASAQTPDSAPHPPEHHPTPTLSSSDIGYVDSLMGIAPAQVMEHIMLKTGIPLPANLGQDIDTSV